MTGIDNLVTGSALQALVGGENTTDNKFVDLDLLLIDEDPDQPRIEFNLESLNELANSIKERGVKTPISVRDGEQGRYVINHGARRYRAAKIAGLAAIPALIDNDYLFIDQVVENIQRDNLTPKEISLAIHRFIKEGMKRMDIANMLGKSNAFVTQYAVIIELPEILKDALDSERCTDITVLYELNNILKKNKDHKDEIEKIIASTDEIVRDTVKKIKALLESKVDKKVVDFEDSGMVKDPLSDNDSKETKKGDKKQVDDLKDDGAADPKEEVDKPLKTLKKPYLLVEVDNEPARVLLNVKPTKPNHLWIAYESDGERSEVAVELVTILDVVELEDLDK